MRQYYTLVPERDPVHLAPMSLEFSFYSDEFSSQVPPITGLLPLREWSMKNARSEGNLDIAISNDRGTNSSPHTLSRARCRSSCQFSVGLFDVPFFRFHNFVLRRSVNFFFWSIFGVHHTVHPDRWLARLTDFQAPHRFQKQLPSVFCRALANCVSSLVKGMDNSREVLRHQYHQKMKLTAVHPIDAHHNTPDGQHQQL